MAPISTEELVVVLVLILIFVYAPGVIYGIAYQRNTKESMIVCIFAGLFQPIYNMLQVPAVIKAVWRELTRQRSWIKTAHYDEDREKAHNETRDEPLS
jgi:Na+(H+)/acetate symporter ActP